MPEEIAKIQRCTIDSGIVTGASGSVTANSGNTPEIGHVQTESPVTFARNDRSRSNGIGGHDGPEYA
ncbi:hypothetical protein, partial [Thiohalocapsa sp. ML1]|uniref:hypothetical protein n=1 Tax=Thiohalocapsa sp. ML1 TaxID=1431688 RepID=UPI001C1F511B